MNGLIPHDHPFFKQITAEDRTREYERRKKLEEKPLIFRTGERRPRLPQDWHSNDNNNSSGD